MFATPPSARPQRAKTCTVYVIFWSATAESPQSEAWPVFSRSPMFQLENVYRPLPRPSKVGVHPASTQENSVHSSSESRSASQDRPEPLQAFTRAHRRALGRSAERVDIGDLVQAQGLRGSLGQRHALSPGVVQRDEHRSRKRDDP